MGRINRSDIIQKEVNDLGIVQDQVAVETSDKVVLTYNLNASATRFIGSTSATTTGALSVTLPTVSTGSQTFITSLCVSFSKDASCDVATGTLNTTVVPFDSAVTSNILRQAVITLTAESDTIAITFPHPILVRNASAVTYGGTFSAGAMARSLSVSGFTTSSY